jgi:hypothetical protein
MRREALLVLKALFVATLHPETMENVLPTQIAAAAALHQACCWEWEDAWQGIDMEGLVLHLQSVMEDLNEARMPLGKDARHHLLERAHSTLNSLLGGLLEGEDEASEDDREES